MSRKRHLAPHSMVDRKELRKCGGRPDEAKDCTVVAVSIAMQMPYADAHQKLKVHANRPDRKGPSSYEFDRFMEKLGYKKVEFETTYRSVNRWYGEVLRSHNLTLKKWLEFPLHRKGRYILSMRGHVFAVVDGVVHDSSYRGPRTNIEGHWRVS